MNDQDRKVIAEIRSKEVEIWENLQRFYEQDCLYILGELANLTNLAKAAALVSPAVAKFMHDSIAYAIPPLARLSKKTNEDVVKDLLALANARNGVSQS